MLGSYNGYLVEKTIKTGVSECYKFRIYPFFFPSTEDIICRSDSNAGYFLNDVLCGSFVKFQRCHHVNKAGSALIIYAQSAYRKIYEINLVIIVFSCRASSLYFFVFLLALLPRLDSYPTVNSKI